jgi:hypothetical protein
MVGRLQRPEEVAAGAYEMVVNSDITGPSPVLAEKQARQIREAHGTCCG